jgi:Protein of unknown function (DUF3616)
MRFGRSLAASIALVALFVRSAPAEPTISMYGEMCDASAAVALDQEHFVVGDDELNVLRVYKRGQSSSVAQIDVSKFLGTKPKKESDIEGAARVGNTVFWISSHGTNKDGEVQDRRRRFFATEVVAGTPPSVRPVGKPYAALVQDLASDPKLTKYDFADAAGRAPKTPGALNIEGLADATDGRLLIGFRNPLPGGKALIIPLENPEELTRNDAPAGTRARFGNPVELDLNGLGVRSIERVGDSYLVVAGPFDAKGDFRLLRWSGKDEKVDPIDAPSLKGLNPEALFAFGETGEIQILSDDGEFKIGSGKCKDAAQAQQMFRSVILRP